MTMKTKVRFFSNIYDGLYRDVIQDNQYQALVQLGELALKEDAPPHVKAFVKAFIKERKDLLTSDRELQAFAILLIALGYINFKSSMTFDWNNPVANKEV